MDLTQPVSKQAEYTSLVIQLKSRYILLVVTYLNDTRVRYLDTYMFSFTVASIFTFTISDLHLYINSLVQ